jgi:hypothetical protein
LEKTHPDIATLVDPLFACGGKRVWELLSLIFLSLFFYPFLTPLFPPQVKRGMATEATPG